MLILFSVQIVLYLGPDPDPDRGPPVEYPDLVEFSFKQYYKLCLLNVC